MKLPWQKSKKPVEPVLPIEHQASIEIVAHKDAAEEVKQEAMQASQHINGLLERNGFTVNIVVGAIGTPKTAKRGH